MAILFCSFIAFCLAPFPTSIEDLVSNLTLLIPSNSTANGESAAIIKDEKSSWDGWKRRRGGKYIKGRGRNTSTLARSRNSLAALLDVPSVVNFLHPGKW